MDTMTTGARTLSLSATLKERMDAEAELFEDLGGAVERLRETLETRSWGPGLAVAQAIERAAGAVDTAEALRAGAFEALRDCLGMPRETAFSAVLPFAPDPARAELEASWRRLRTAVVRLKTAASRTRYATEALADALNRILEQVFPYRRGKIYSRKGTPTRVDGALLVNRQL